MSVGTVPGQSDVHGPVNFHSSTNQVCFDKALQHNETYYVTVEARNRDNRGLSPVVANASSNGGKNI